MNRFLVKNNFKTPPFLLTLYLLILTFVPFLIIWILIGEFNTLGLFYLFPQNGVLWHGYVTNDNINQLVASYGQYHANLQTQLQDVLTNSSDTQWAITADYGLFNPLIFIYLAAALVWSIIYPFIFKLLKFSHIDILPFSVALASGMISLIMSGLIPYWSQDFASVWWLVRLFIVLFAFIILFLLANYFVNLYLAKSKYANDYAYSIGIENKNNSVYKQDLKASLKEFSDQKNDKDYVEVEITSKKEKK